MKKKVSILLSILLVAVFVLAACGGSQYTLKVSVQYENGVVQYDTIEIKVDGDPVEAQGEGIKIEFERKINAGTHTITLVNPADSSMIAETKVDLNQNKQVTITLNGNNFDVSESIIK